MKKIIKNKKGAAMLMTVVIISSVVLIIAFSSSMIGLGELQLGYSSQKSGEAMIAADACMEEALYKLRLDSGYTGETLSINQISCIITVSGSDIIVAATLENKYYKTIEANVTLSVSSLSINSWEEVSN
jgi:hypothetical protein